MPGNRVWRKRTGKYRRSFRKRFKPYYHSVMRPLPIQEAAGRYRHRFTIPLHVLSHIASAEEFRNHLLEIWPSGYSWDAVGPSPVTISDTEPALSRWLSNYREFMVTYMKARWHPYTTVMCGQTDRVV